MSFEHFCSLDALYDASYNICRSVRWKDSTIMFEENRLDTVLQTEEDLRNNEYEQMVFSSFSVIERGKERNIRACHISDRMVHNSLCENVLIPELTPKFIYDNCATLKNKGIEFAIKRAKKHLQSAHRAYGLGKDFFGARIDIKQYFDSIDHKSLKEMVKKTIKDNSIRQLVEYFIDTFCFALTKDSKPIPNKTYYLIKNRQYITVKNCKFFKHHRHYYEYNPKSLGLGSQTSQLLALLTLNEIDHFIKEQLHIKYYGRYMDDLYLFHNDAKYLQYCIDEIEKRLNNIGLLINKKKTYVSRIHPINKGEKKKQPFKYLKWNFYITTTNKIIQLPYKKKLAKERHKLRKLKNLYEQGRVTIEDIWASYQSWRAYLSKGDTFHILQEMDNYLYSLFKGVDLSCFMH